MGVDGGTVTWLNDCRLAVCRRGGQQRDGRLFGRGLRTPARHRHAACRQNHLKSAAGVSRWRQVLGVSRRSRSMALRVRQPAKAGRTRAKAGRTRVVALGQVDAGAQAGRALGCHGHGKQSAIRGLQVPGPGDHGFAQESQLGPGGHHKQAPGVIKPAGRLVAQPRAPVNRAWRALRPGCRSSACPIAAQCVRPAGYRAPSGPGRDTPVRPAGRCRRHAPRPGCVIRKTARAPSARRHQPWLAG